mmetsp:Transcript_8796/g.21707  ORF Transcript_8796/g.21707 Transcript_8796/m.21707 type:complete len:205 (-) Transcript_8796:925-1539(-)
MSRICRVANVVDDGFQAIIVKGYLVRGLVAKLVNRQSRGQFHRHFVLFDDQFCCFLGCSWFLHHHESLEVQQDNLGDGENLHRLRGNLTLLAFFAIDLAVFRSEKFGQARVYSRLDILPDIDGQIPIHFLLGSGIPTRFALQTNLHVPPEKIVRWILLRFAFAVLRQLLVDLIHDLAQEFMRVPLLVSMEAIRQFVHDTFDGLG